MNATRLREFFQKKVLLEKKKNELSFQYYKWVDNA